MLSDLKWSYQICNGRSNRILVPRCIYYSTTFATYTTGHILNSLKSGAGLSALALVLSGLGWALRPEMGSIMPDLGPLSP